MPASSLSDSNYRVPHQDRAPLAERRRPCTSISRGHPSTAAQSPRSANGSSDPSGLNTHTGVFILALNIKGAVFPERLDALSSDLPALIEINASSVNPQLQRLN